MARASTLGRVCVGAETPAYGVCFSTDHEHIPNPEWWITEDGHQFKVGDRLWNYYDCEWGVVVSEPDPIDGWFDFQPVEFEPNLTRPVGRRMRLNSVRVSRVRH